MPAYEITPSDAPFAALPGSEYRVTWEATGPGGTRRDAFVGYFIEVVRFMGVDYASFARHNGGRRYEQHTPLSVITGLTEIIERFELDADTLATLARYHIEVGNYIDCADALFDDADSGVITRVRSEAGGPSAGGTVLIEWRTANGELREDTLSGLVKTVEDRLAEIVVRPICGCPEHANGLIEATECFCGPECIRGEARHLDVTSREALIAWLVESDPQGCYTDEDATLEWGQPHTLETLQGAYRAVWDME